MGLICGGMWDSWNSLQHGISQHSIIYDVTNIGSDYELKKYCMLVLTERKLFNYMN